MEDPQRNQRIIRTHLHDVRNSINCFTLETDWLEHLSTDPEVAASVMRLQSELRELEATMQALQAKIFQPRPSTLTANELFLLWKHQIEPLENASHQISWESAGKAATLVLDVDAILSVLRELVTTAWHRNSNAMIHAALATDAKGVFFRLREPHQEISSGAQDLEEIQRIAAANGGTLASNVDTHTREKITILEFPLTS